MNQLDSWQNDIEDFQDTCDSVLDSTYKTIAYNLNQFLDILDRSILFSKTISALPSVDFDDWHDEAKSTIRSMVGSGQLNWPADKNERVAIQLALLRHVATGSKILLNFAHNFTYAGLKFDDSVHKFTDQIFKPFIRDFSRLAERNSKSIPSNEQQMPEQLIEIFISHSSRDGILAEAIIELIKNSLGIAASEIRCTSIEGYKLPVGADTDEQLRVEIHSAKVLIGIISPASVESMYVMFELGARWGASKPLLPLLANGSSSSILRGPLSGINGLRCDSETDMQQFVTDLADVLNRSPMKPAVYQRYVHAVASIEVGTSSQGVSEEISSPSSSLDAVEIKIMKLAADNNDHNLTIQQVHQSLGISIKKSEYHLDELQRKDYLSWMGSLNPGEPAFYPLTHEGRKYLVKNDLV